MATVHSLAAHQRPQAANPAPELRTGPRPLGLHLMTALGVWLSLPALWPSLNSALPGLNPELAARWQNLRQKLQSAGSPDPLAAAQFTQALTEEALSRAHRFMQGVRAYRQHPARRSVPETPVIWQRGSTTLRDYNPEHPLAPPVLVIPSLINRFDILDLDLAPSFLRSLAARGLRPLAVDWGRPGAEEKDFGISEYVTERLIPIIEGLGTRGLGLGKNHKSPSPQPLAPNCHVIGYCMGGLLALALAAHRPESIRSLTLLATPWDFHAPDPAIGAQFMALAETLDAEFEALGEMPVDVIQGLFASLQPMQALAKFGDFAQLDPGSMEARQFVLVEDWLNDGIPLTVPVARECLIDWYGKNVTANGTWKVAGKLVDPRKLAMPAYVVVPGRDRIVPPESALALARLLPHSTLHEPMTGHIGMMASRNAAHQVWAPMLHWLEEHG